MIKGVNRQVVEVSETGSDYFEKALFFVNPKYYGLAEGKIKEKAQSMMSTAGSPPKTKTKKRSKLITFLQISAAAVAGSLVTLLINILAF